MQGMLDEKDPLRILHQFDQKKPGMLRQKCKLLFYVINIQSLRNTCLLFCIVLLPSKNIDLSVSRTLQLQ